MVEGIRSVVRERIDCWVVVISEPSGNQFEAILQVEVFWFLAYYFLEPLYASHCHLDAYHHVEDQIPIFVSNEHHWSLGIFYSFVYVLESVFRFFYLKIKFLHFLLQRLVNMLGLPNNFINFFFNKLQFLLQSLNSTVLIQILELIFLILVPKVRFSAGIAVVFAEPKVFLLFESANMSPRFIEHFLWLSKFGALSFIHFWFFEDRCAYIGQSWRTLLKSYRLVEHRLLIRHVKNSLLDLMDLLDNFVENSFRIVVFLADEDVGNPLSDKLEWLTVIFVFIELISIVF